MIVVVREEGLPQAKAIMQQYGCKLSYSKLFYQGQPFYAISEGPIGALLLIRAQVSSEEIQRRFGLT